MEILFRLTSALTYLLELDIPSCGITKQLDHTFRVYALGTQGGVRFLIEIACPFSRAINDIWPGFEGLVCQ